MNKLIKPEDLELTPGWLLLKPYEPHVDGFVASQNSEDKPHFGEVVNESSQYNLGDILLFGMHSTATQSINGKIYYLLREEDVIAKVRV